MAEKLTKEGLVVGLIEEEPEEKDVQPETQPVKRGRPKAETK